MYVKKSIFLLLSVGFWLAVGAQTSALLPEGVPEGKYPVGFRTFFELDSSRLINEAAYRPMQIAVWYPGSARNDKDARLRIEEYFALSLQEKSPERIAPAEQAQAIADFKGVAVKSGITEHGFDQLFQSPGLASRNLPIARKNFPVILVMQGNGHAIYNLATFCAFLASHGYIVISTPSPTRIGGAFKDFETLVATAQDQRDDLFFALQQMRRQGLATSKKVGLLAYSFGARAALLYAQQHPAQAFVSLDGGIANANGKEWIDYVADFQPEKISTPILHFYQAGDRSVVPDFELMDRLTHADSYRIQIKDVNHGFFFIRGTADAAIENFLEKSYKQAKEKKVIIYRYTLDFFDALLKDKSTAKKALSKIPSIDKTYLNVEVKLHR